MRWAGWVPRRWRYFLVDSWMRYYYRSITSSSGAMRLPTQQEVRRIRMLRQWRNG